MNKYFFSDILQVLNLARSMKISYLEFLYTSFNQNAVVELQSSTVVPSFSKEANLLISSSRSALFTNADASFTMLCSVSTVEKLLNVLKMKLPLFAKRFSNLSFNKFQKYSSKTKTVPPAEIGVLGQVFLTR